MNKSAIIASAVFCAGMLCSIERRYLAFLLIAALAALVVVRFMAGRVSLSFIHIPLAVLPISYLIAMIASGGITYYSIGQTILMCVPLLVSLSFANVRNVIPVVLIGVGFLGIVSLLGPIIAFIPNSFTPAGFNSDPRLRLQTLLNYANTGAMFFGCAIIALFDIHAGKSKIIKSFSILLLSALLLLTRSRLAIIITLALLVAYALLQRGAKKTLIIVFSISVTIVIAIILTKPDLILDSSLAMRMIYWADALKAFAKSPGFGLGPEGFVFQLHELQSAKYAVTLVHSSFLQVAVDAGAIAVISLLTISYISLRRAWKESKHVFLVMLLLLLHSAVDIDLSFFPTLMLLGLCCSHSATPTLLKKKKLIISAAIIPILLISVVLMIGEHTLSNGVKYDRSGKLEEAEMSYQSSLLWMPGDFRSSIRLSGVYILQHKQEKAIEFLKTTDYENFNKASRSELLVIAYKNLGIYTEWDIETQLLLEYAPLKESSYTERSEYLVAAYYSLLLTNDEYLAEYAALQKKLDDANSSLNHYVRFLLEKDRTLTPRLLTR